MAYIGEAGIEVLTSVQHNLSAVVDPTITDDTNADYSPGSRWVNSVSNEEFVCVDATAGAAVWELTTGGGVASDIPSTPVGNVSATNVQAAIAELDSEKSDTSHNHDAAYINTSGDTMTGDLTLAGDPTNDLHAAPKQYVINKAAQMLYGDPYANPTDYVEPVGVNTNDWWGYNTKVSTGGNVLAASELDGGGTVNVYFRDDASALSGVVIPDANVAGYDLEDMDAAGTTLLVADRTLPTSGTFASLRTYEIDRAAQTIGAFQSIAIAGEFARISGNGLVLVVADRTWDTPFTNSGRARIYYRATLSAAWTFAAEINGVINQDLGVSIGIDYYGNVTIGSHFASTTNTAGKIEYYERVNSVSWVLSSTLRLPDFNPTTRDLFSRYHAISPGGTTIVSQSSNGSLHFYEKRPVLDADYTGPSSISWEYVGSLPAGLTANNGNLYSNVFSFNHAGDQLIVSNPTADSNTGIVNMCVKNGGEWQVYAELLSSSLADVSPATTSGMNGGQSVAFADAAGLVFMGAPRWNGGFADFGKVYIRKLESVL